MESTKTVATVAAAALALILTACSDRKPLWEDQPLLTDDVVASLLGPSPTSAFDRDLLAGEVPVVPVRKRLRPCCVFGHGLNAELGPIPIPGIKIQNVIGVDDLGAHHFDAGMLLAGSDDGDFLASEANGLVYTCRGGFIDTAHVRDYADWTMFVGPALARNLETGATIALPPEGGTRSIVLAPIPPEVIETYGRRRLAISMAEWVVFQMSIWHEIATWYGWSAVPLFPERASAFSPEDLYSNALGIRLAAGVVAVRAASNDTSYDRTIDRWTRSALHELGALDRKDGVEAADLVDGVWWDSARRVPDERLLLRRNIDLSRELVPWTVGQSGRVDDDEGLKACRSKDEPIPLVIPEDLGALRFADFVSLHVQPDPAIKDKLPTGEREITQADFDAIAASIRDAAFAEFGPRADSPAE